MAKFSWNTPLKNQKNVQQEKTTFQVGDTVKLVGVKNTKKGLDKNGRTGEITRIINGEYEVLLHCTDTGGHIVRTIFNKTLGRFVGETGEKQWFTKEQIYKV